MKAYERLAKFYKNDWGKESSKYTVLVSRIIKDYSLQVNSILDVACGTGILASELYKMNFNVCGVDISEHMIHVARENHKNIEFNVSNMTDFSFNKKFDLITCSFDSINYLTNDEDMRKALENIFNHLEANGFFIFDINTPALYEERHFGTIKRRFEDITFNQILEYDKDKRLGKTTFDFGCDGVEVHIQKAYTSEDMDKFLIRAGFKILNKCKNFKLSPINEKTYKIFYVVKREE